MADRVTYLLSVISILRNLQDCEVLRLKLVSRLNMVANIPMQHAWRNLTNGLGSAAVWLAQKPSIYRVGVAETGGASTLDPPSIFL